MRTQTTIASLTSLIGLGIGLLALSGPVAAQPDAGDGPAGIKAAGQCTLHTFNMDASQPATVSASRQQAIRDDMVQSTNVSVDQTALPLGL